MPTYRPGGNRAKRKTTMATEKQVRYVMFLLDQQGFSTRYMDASFKALGATMRERSGSVESWVRGLDFGRASSLIDTLKAR